MGTISINKNMKCKVCHMISISYVSHQLNLSICKLFYSQLKDLNELKILNGVPAPHHMMCVCGGRGIYGDVMRFVYFQGERNAIPNRVAYGASSIHKRIGISTVMCLVTSKLFN